MCADGPSTFSRFTTQNIQEAQMFFIPPALSQRSFWGHGPAGTNVLRMEGWSRLGPALDPDGGDLGLF